VHRKRETPLRLSVSPPSELGSLTADCCGDDTGSALFAPRMHNNEGTTAAISVTKFCRRNLIMAPLLPQIYLETLKINASDIRRLPLDPSKSSRQWVELAQLSFP